MIWISTLIRTRRAPRLIALTRPETGDVTATSGVSLWAKTGVPAATMSPSATDSRGFSPV